MNRAPFSTLLSVSAILVVACGGPIGLPDADTLMGCCASDTGTYFAGGALIGSTLSHTRLRIAAKDACGLAMRSEP